MRDFYEYRDKIKTYKNVKSVLAVEGKIEKPDITIFIPTYKRAETLMVSVESAINQVGNYNYEILIVNNDPDGINGNSRELVENLNNEKIYYYVNEENIGLCVKRNGGIELARHKYVGMIHWDDILIPWFLAAMMPSIKATEEPEILGVSFVKFDSSNMPEFRKPVNLRYRNVTKKSYFFGKYINIAGMTVKREFILKLGGYADEYLPNEDSVLIYQVLLEGRVVNIESILAGYRQEMNLTLSGDTMKRIIEEVEYTRRVIAKHESFAATWMRYFDKEYLYRYVIGANRHWGLNIDPYEIYEMVGLPKKPINKIKYVIMRGLLKYEQTRVKK